MASIFDLKTNVSELSSANQGTSRMSYDQTPPTRDITLNNFPNGAIHFRWQTSGAKWWVPQRSYLRFRCSLSKANGTALTLADNIAPNMNLAAGLFQSMEFRINDKTVSRVSDFVPQVDSLDKRMKKSKAWMDSIGVSTNFWEEDFKSRQADVSSNGLNVDEPYDVASRLELGYDAATNTVAVAADTGVLTFAANGGQALPLNANVWATGDEIEIDMGGAVGTVRYRVSAVINATTLQLNNLQTIAFVAAGVGFRRYRRSIDNARQLSSFEITWCPPLSIFGVPSALPSGKYELVLNPQTSSVYQLYAIESLTAKTPNTATAVAPSANSNFLFQIVDMYMYVATVEGPRADDITYLLDLEQTRCQSEKIDTASFQQKNFDVSPSTFALTVAYQDLRAGTDSRVSSTKFKSYDNAFASLTGEELKLSRFFINYAGQNLPSVDADPSFVAGTDYTVQRYLESQIYSGAYFDTGGAETIEEYHDRGSYYYFAWPRDGTDRSTRVNVHSQMSGADVVNMRVLLFDHSKQVARIKVQDGRVVDVQLEDN
jgi:hypothetical protein